MSSSPPPPTGYTATNLVANSTAISAVHTDSNLINAWGLAFNPTAYAWISDSGSQASPGTLSTLYDGNGVAQTAPGASSPDITIPAGASGVSGPTGIVYNPTTQFVITASAGGASAPALFLYATLGGTIEGWAQSVNPNSAVIAYDAGVTGATYAGAGFTGLTMAKDSSGNYFLYAADFKNCTVDVFNSNFMPQTVGGAFFDSSVPSGYCPYGIQNIPSSSGSAQIYVTYAEPAPSSPQKVAIGAGLGYVAVFDTTGTLIAHLVSQGALNAPWGVAMAPSNFGPLGGDLLIGNFGDGAINAYNPSTGASMGNMMSSSGGQLFIPGLWALQFGNGTSTEPANTLFFTAGPDTQTAGAYGRIDVAGTYSPPSSSGMMGGY